MGGPRRCAIDGCPRRVKARGLCFTHYDGMRRTGQLDQHPTLSQEHMGLHTARDVVETTGITYRMLDHWCRRGVLGSTHQASGSGDYRRFSDADIVGIRAVLAAWEAARQITARVQSGETFRQATAEATEQRRSA